MLDLKNYDKITHEEVMKVFKNGYEKGIEELKEKLSDEQIKAAFKVLYKLTDELYKSDTKTAITATHAFHTTMKYMFDLDTEFIKKIIKAQSLEYSLSIIDDDEVTVYAGNSEYDQGFVFVYDDGEVWVANAESDYRVEELKEDVKENDFSNLITLKEYADMHGVADSTVRCKIRNGNLKATKKGRDWFIDKDEPYIDNRYKK